MTKTDGMRFSDFPKNFRGCTGATHGRAGLCRAHSIEMEFDGGGTSATQSSLGLSAGSSFYFDVVSSYTNPSGQAAYGALDNTGYIPESDNNYAPWNGTSHYDSATSPNSFFGTAATEYTVQAVPEPSTLALMGIGALGVLRRSSRRGKQG